jgi:hypothetical protein
VNVTRANLVGKPSVRRGLPGLLKRIPGPADVPKGKTYSIVICKRTISRYVRQCDAFAGHFSFRGFLLGKRYGGLKMNSISQVLSDSRRSVDAALACGRHLFGGVCCSSTSLAGY